MSSERIEALEIALSHAEAEIADLSETCKDQWREIDALKKELGRVTRSIEAMLTANEDEAPPADQRPPHY